MRLFAGTEFDVPIHCDRCGLLVQDCQCPPVAKLPPAPENQQVRLSREKRKKGKMVTVVAGIHPACAADLLKQLKNHCGAGGTIKEDTIEIQGQHLERVEAWLKQAGYKVRTLR
jgi:translation initiation factor 1